ncbi:MAG: GspE/PulE family protein [Puniceicoccales bacterium]|jgi:type II secretory ATPase GspE/PulE/Tfp pilus assembly ATPase PilB-like protein|nr:GspE/PulE family protein [Puniceicoccales bacterium]
MTSLAEKLSELGKENFAKIMSEPLHRRVGALAKILNCDDEREAALWLAEVLEMPFAKEFMFRNDVVGKIPIAFFTEHYIIPTESIADEGKSSEDELCMVTCWPVEEKICRQVEMFCGKYPKMYMATPYDVMSEMAIHFEFIDADENLQPAKKREPSSENAEADAEEAIVKFVNDVIRRALKSRATDIHFEPQRDSLRIRYRIDGDLVPIRVPENLVKFQAAIISRLKIMSHLNISEKRRPQDGKISFRDSKEIIDIRVSTLPIVYGESISLRLLTQGGHAPTSLDGLNMTEQQLRVTEKALGKPHGIILVTGPTGSGKSTTLGSFLRHVDSPAIRLITVEDPVEYDIAGANQSQVNSEIGMTFANILRSILRQDPDVIMLGEIRDSETGDIAIRAAVTGHLVLSTLHTNDAIGSITRLKDIGIERYMIASALEMVCAQRLVRRLCPHCARESKKFNDPEERERLCRLFEVFNLPEDSKFMEAVGCEHCNGVGYRGRMAVFEILGMSERIHEAIVNGSTESEMRKIAVEDGMTFLAQDAFSQACRGNTTVDEAILLIP